MEARAMVGAHFEAASIPPRSPGILFRPSQGGASVRFSDVIVSSSLQKSFIIARPVTVV